MNDVDSVAVLLRKPPALAPEDSIGRAASLLKHTGSELAPVADSRGVLRGVVGSAELRALLGQADGLVAVGAAVSTAMRSPEVVLARTATVGEARSALSTSRDPVLFVLDERGRLLGAVVWSDLLQAETVPPRPVVVGGMATPWGVYLHAGLARGGVGDLSLLLSGATLGLLFALSYGIVGAAAYVFQQIGGWPLYDLWYSGPASAGVEALAWVALQAAALPAFLLLLRALPLSGYHAAEHQTVHALERGEPLRPDVVSRMPRVHARCGTNLLAGAVVFAGVLQVALGLGLDGLGAMEGALLGAVGALFTWRSVGTWLQRLFTTRAPTPRQVAAAVAAGQQLEQSYSVAFARRPTLIRRLWAAGLPQTAAGAAAGLSAAVWAGQTLLGVSP
ncbi:MAG TPA: DUF1385 domain-containing protein [Chthonomonadales bacterium]|nr:DUF1385 domain-containing protein [Chthonomonadales bacterium]